MSVLRSVEARSSGPYNCLIGSPLTVVNMRAPCITYENDRYLRPAESPVHLLQGDPEDNRPPVRADIRHPSLQEIVDQTAHLRLRKWISRLDRGTTGERFCQV